MKFRKKPVVIEAFRIGYDDYPVWFNDEIFSGRNLIHDVYEGAGCIIETMEGQMKANHGDYIIQGIQGEFYPCKPDIFEKTYESVAISKTETVGVSSDGFFYDATPKQYQCLGCRDYFYMPQVPTYCPNCGRRLEETT